MKKYSISIARRADLPDIKTIETECGLSPWTIGAYEAEQASPNSVMLKGEAEDGSIVGFLLGRTPIGGEAEIYNIGIAPRFRRRGLGSGLIEEFRVICVERRVSAIWLEVRAGNSPAIEFYKSHGFVKKGSRPRFYSNPTEDAELMSLYLPGVLRP